MDRRIDLKYRSDLKFDECPVCNAENNSIYYVNKINNRYFRCNKCHCLFIDNCAKVDPYPMQALNPYEQLRGFNKDLRSNKLWTYSIWYINWLFKYLQHFNLTSSPKALSIGCAYGHDLFELKKRGWDVLGIDHDESFVRRVMNQHKINVLHGFFEEIEFFQKFDLVLLASVLPYLSDLNFTMNKIKSILNSEGFIFLSIRTIDFNKGKNVLSYSTNIHARHYFSQKSLSLLFNKFDFDVIAIDPFKIDLPILNNMPLKFKKYLNNCAGLYDKLLNLNYIARRFCNIGSYKNSTIADSDQLLLLAINR